MDNFIEESNAEPERHPHVFKNLLDVNLDPFSKNETLKFIRISPQLLISYATAHNIELTEDNKKTGLMIIGEESQKHAAILADALGIPDKEAVDIKVSDAGLITKLNDKKVAIFSISGSLMAEDGRLLTRLDDQKINELHIETANVLAKMFDSSEGVTNYDFIPVPSSSR